MDLHRCTFLSFIQSSCTALPFMLLQSVATQYTCHAIVTDSNLQCQLLLHYICTYLIHTASYIILYQTLARSTMLYKSPYPIITPIRDISVISSRFQCNKIYSKNLFPIYFPLNCFNAFLFGVFRHINMDTFQL